MRLLLLSAVLLAGACATTAPAEAPPPDGPAAPPDTTEVPTADVRLVGYPGGGAEMSVSLAGDVPVSPTEPARLVYADQAFSARLETPPFTSREGDVVTSVTYRLDASGQRWAESAGNRLELYLHDGTAYRRYAVRRTDLIE